MYVLLCNNLDFFKAFGSVCSCSDLVQPVLYNIVLCVYYNDIKLYVYAWVTCAKCC